MTISKAWDWEKGRKDAVWFIPSEESHYLAWRWKRAACTTLLDLGCGLGRHSIFYAEQGFTVSATDLSPVGVANLQQWAKSEGLAIDAKVSDMLHLPYPDATFDCLLAYHVIYHTGTAGITHILSEISRVLKPGGECFVTFISKESPAYRDMDYPRLDENTLLKTAPGPEQNVPHYYTDLPGLIELFKGLDIISIRHINDCYFDGTQRDSRHFFVLARRI